MFAPIKGYEGLYEVNEEGVIISTGEGQSNNSQLRVLKQYGIGIQRNYLSVKLYRNGKGTSVRVHRIVAETFINKPEGCDHVHHMDENTFNNHADNLQWVTPQYNKEFSSSKHYILVSPDGILTEVFNLSKFCRENNISNGSIYHLLSGKYKQCKGWCIP